MFIYLKKNLWESLVPFLVHILSFKKKIDPELKMGLDLFELG